MRTALFVSLTAAGLIGTGQAGAQSFCVTCYANCDQSTAQPVLNANDFVCFLNAYTAASQLPYEQQVTHYANCDESTANPAITANDFVCFNTRYTQGCATLAITPSSGGLGTSMNLTLSNTTLTFDANTTATWTGTFTPAGGSSTASFTVAYGPSQFHEISTTSASLVLGDGAFTNAPNVAGLGGTGTLVGQLILNFGGGQLHHQCITISVTGDTSQWRAVSYLSVPTSPGAATIGAILAQIPMFAVSDFPNATSISEEALLAAKEYHLVPVVLVNDNTQSSNAAPSTISIDLIAYSAAGTELSRLAGVSFAKLGTTVAPGSITYAPDLLQPILVIDTALVPANYPNIRFLTCDTAGTVAIVPHQ